MQNVAALTPYLFVRVPLLLTLLSFSCASRSLILQSEGEAELSELTAGKIGEEPKKLGKTPYTLDLDQDTGKVFVLTQKMKVPTYIVLSELWGTRNEFFLRPKTAEKLPASGSEGEATKASKKIGNQELRMMMQAMKNYYSGNSSEALRLSQEASQLNPDLAGPWLLRAKALKMRGELAQAKQALLEAKQRDPEDPEINKMAVELGGN